MKINYEGEHGSVQITLHKFTLEVVTREGEDSCAEHVEIGVEEYAYESDGEPSRTEYHFAEDGDLVDQSHVHESLLENIEMSQEPLLEALVTEIENGPHDN